MDTKEQFYCPMSTAVDVIGGKWKTVILYHLLEKETMRFSELKRTLTGVTQKMLTAQLRSLEADGLVRREVYPVIPPKVEYSLTELGKTLEPVIYAMKNWGQAFSEHKTAD